MPLAAPILFSCMPLKLKETDISKKHNSQQGGSRPVGNLDELGSTDKQLQLSGQSGT